MAYTGEESFRRLGFKVVSSCKYLYEPAILIYKGRGNEYVVFNANKTYHYFYVDQGVRHTRSYIPEDILKAVSNVQRELGWYSR